MRRERDAIATLARGMGEARQSARIQGLAQRHLKLKPVEATKIDTLDKLPERPAGAACRSPIRSAA